MLNYCHVNPYLLWNGATFSAFSDDSKWVYCYVLIHSELTSLGAMCISLANLVQGLNWPLERFQKALNPCSEQNLVAYDESYSLLWIVNFFHHELVPSPQAMMEWQTDEDKLPECPLKEKIMTRALSEAKYVLEFYFQNNHFETDEQIPLFVSVWLQAFKAHVKKQEED
jgi:hypothetical protein